MRIFCTIITKNYFAFAVSLYRSLAQFHKNEKLVVLICDGGELNQPLVSLTGITIIHLVTIYNYKETHLLFEKYSEDQMDAFRWSMKSVLIRYLLESGYEKVIYVDCDIFFFSDYEFLFEELDTSDILLTPSWRTINYEKNEEEFSHLYTDGLYNAGFIGANKKGIAALEWWTKVCLYRIAIDRERGLFVDQKYLDAMPLMFSNVKIIKHRGCNISIWNQHECTRISRDGNVWINGTDPIVFIHFNNNYIRELREGNDPALLPYLKQYETIFAESGFILSDFIEGLPAYEKPGLLKTIKQKTLLRTRFKNLMQKLIDKI